MAISETRVDEALEAATAETGVAHPLAALRETADPLDRRAALARVQRGLFAAAEESLRIGRFVVIERLGAGASGVVYAAYDPQLDRKVALKLLRNDVELGDEAHARLQREAQALAKLAHPHVVAVHDVGDVDGRVFIAMELLPGGTLRQFVEAEPRPLAEVMAVYLQAGEGLAAAHAAGLVHRDFKPDNALLDARGQVRVVDFGLARDEGHPSRSMVELVVTAERLPVELNTQLTQTGAVLGTPAYMAPEQLAGRPADALSDQFAFCVALHEALHGERPFAGETLHALAEATQQGTVRPAPPGRSVPAWIRRALLVGLRPRPSDRHPDMHALLKALRHDPGAHWRRRGLVAGGLLAVVGLTWVAADRPELAAAAPCSGLQGQLDGVWDEARRTTIAAGMVASGHPNGAAIWERVEPRLDEYASAWVSARRDACEATEVRREQSADLLDRRVLCLDRAHAVLRAAVDRLEHADRQTVARATELVPGRELVDECGAMGVLDEGDPPPPDPDVREAVHALQDRIAVVFSLRQAGKYPTALADANTLVLQAAIVDHAPTSARALWELGGALAENRRPHEAVDVLARAVAQAERGRSDRTRVLALHGLVRRLSDTAQLDEARRVATVAEALYGRLAHPPAGAAVRVESMWGHIEWSAGHYDAALERFARAMALAEGDPDPVVQMFYADAIVDMGAVMTQAGRAREALPLLQRGLATWTAQMGPDHPEVASIHSNLGSMYLRLDRDDDAARELLRSLEIREQTLGVDHDSLAPTLSNLGALAQRGGRFAESLAYLERSLVLMERSLGESSPELAGPLHNLALVHLHLERPEQALALVRRALKLRRDGLGPAHARTIDSMYQLGYVEKQAGHPGAAREAFAEHLRLIQAHRPEDEESQVYSLVGLADVALLEGRPAQAQAAMERAQPLLGDAPEQAQLRMAVGFNLARALDARGREPARAKALAQAALADADTGHVQGEQRELIVRWLAERGAPAGE